MQNVTPELNIPRIMDTCELSIPQNSRKQYQIHILLLVFNYMVWFIGTRQMGYPVLTYIVNGNQLTVRQARFLSDPNKKSVKDDSPYGFVIYIDNIVY